MSTIPKLQLIYMNIIDLYQRQHPKWDVKFLPEETMKEMAELYATRLNLKNPFECGNNPLATYVFFYGEKNISLIFFLGLNFGLDLSKCPKEKDKKWKTIKLSDLPLWRRAFDIEIPEMDVDDYDALIWLLLSPYR